MGWNRKQQREKKVFKGKMKPPIKDNERKVVKDDLRRYRQAG